MGLLETLVVVLIVLWALGMISGPMLIVHGVSAIHLLIALALVLIVIRVLERRR